MYNKPTLVCNFKSDGYAKGSCRSTKDFNILDALKSDEAWKLFKKRADGSTVCGGHAFAAGFELPIENIPAMRKALNEYAKDKLGEPSSEKLIEVDAKMLFGDLNIKTFAHLSKLSPFGSGNHNPIFITKNMTLVEAKPLTQGKHAKLKLSNGEKTWVPANAWRKGYICKEFNTGDKVDVIYTIELDNWSGNNNLILIIEDIKPAS